MLKPAATVLLLLSLSGCGAHGLVTATSAKSSLGASALATASTTLAIATAVETDGAAGEDGTPTSESYVISGKDGSAAFRLVITAVNPGGALYLPKPSSVMVNDKALPAADYAALAIRLQSAKIADNATRDAVYRAGSILQLSR